jgi:hypothetical protein
MSWLEYAGLSALALGGVSALCGVIVLSGESIDILWRLRNFHPDDYVTQERLRNRIANLESEYWDRHRELTKEMERLTPKDKDVKLPSPTNRRKTK